MGAGFAVICGDVDTKNPLLVWHILHMQVNQKPHKVCQAFIFLQKLLEGTNICEKLAFAPDIYPFCSNSSIKIRQIKTLVIIE